MKTSRRQILRALTAAPAAAAFAWTDAEAQQAVQQSQAVKTAATPFRPRFFTRHEYATIRLLVDLIIPKDERSGSATDAGVPEFMDFMMVDQPARQTAMRGGLAWLDRECVSRFEKDFVTCTPAERTEVLDDISWPRKARPERAHGVAFFNSFRDLTASGFFTSKMGIADLQYMGNRFVAEWTGCPPEVLKKLGLP
jgi:gluconate 2-dehydrogenase gamma chain